MFAWLRMLPSVDEEEGEWKYVVKQEWASCPETASAVAAGGDVGWLIDWSIYDEWTFDSLHTLHFLSFTSFGFCEKHAHTDCEYTDPSVSRNHVLRAIF